MVVAPTLGHQCTVDRIEAHLGNQYRSNAMIDRNWLRFVEPRSNTGCHRPSDRRENTTTTEDKRPLPPSGEGDTDAAVPRSGIQEGQHADQKEDAAPFMGCQAYPLSRICTCERTKMAF